MVRATVVLLLTIGLAGCRFDPSGVSLADRRGPAADHLTERSVVDLGAHPAERGAADRGLATEGKCTLGGWWNPAWRARRKIIVTPDPKDASTVALPNFPLPITLDLTAYGGKLTPSNLRLVSGNAALSHEVELWRPGQAALVWVRLPALVPASGAELWVYFDNPATADAADPPAVWDGSFVGVWHLQQPVGGLVPDSTSGAKPAKQEGTAQPSDQGRFGAGYSFDGNGWLRIASTGSDKLAVSGTFTLEGWGFGSMSTEQTAHYTLVGRQCGSSYWDAYTLVVRGEGGLDSRFQTTGGSSCGAADIVTGPFSKGAWHHLAGVRTGNSLALYVDGVLAATKAVGATTVDANDVLIGAEENGGGSTPSEEWEGRLDEVRISKVARTVSWIRATYRAGADPSMLTLGAPESCAP